MDAIKAKLEELQQRRAAVYNWLCTTEQYQELLQLNATIGVLSELAEGGEREIKIDSEEQSPESGN